MAVRVDLIKNEKYYPSRLKKFFRADLNYHTYDKFIPYMKKAVVGNIPPEVINLFNKTDKGEKIKSFQNALSSITKYSPLPLTKTLRERPEPKLRSTTPCLP